MTDTHPFSPRPPRVARILAAAYTGLIVILSAQPNLAPPTIHGIRLNDKLLHALEYTVFSVLWVWVVSAGAVTRRAALKVLALGALFAISDEIHQSFVPNRQADIADFLADVVGILIGAAFFWAVRRCASRPGRASAAT